MGLSLFALKNLQGITVIYVEPNSTILGPSGLKVGDVITSLNGCEVKDSRQWHHCLSLADQVKLIFLLD